MWRHFGVELTEVPLVESRAEGGAEGDCKVPHFVTGCVMVPSDRACRRRGLIGGWQGSMLIISTVLESRREAKRDAI